MKNPNQQPVFEPEFFKQNRLKLRKIFGGTAPIIVTANGHMQRSGDTVFPFRQDSNFWYLTGIDQPGLVLVMEPGSEYLIIPEQDERHVVFEGGIDVPSLQETSGIQEIVPEGEAWKRLGKRLKRVKHIATLEPAPALVQQTYTNPARFRLIELMKTHNPELQTLDLRPHLAKLRAVKSKPEITAIKYSIYHTTKVFQQIKRRLNSYKNEQDILADIHQYAIRYGLGFGYDPVIASGKNALTLHYITNNASLNPKDPILLDVGLSYRHYSADISRTICLQPSKRYLQVHNAVQDVHDFALSELKPGVLLAEYEKMIEHFMGEKLRELGLIGSIDKEEVRQFYPHSSSHFLGLDVHDVGDYSQPLAPGMVLTVEPGIYIKAEGFGIRLENDILITKTDNKVLSSKLPNSLN